MKKSMKVAGVTFNNSDGTSRQKLLASLGEGWHKATLKHVVFDGKPAIEVRINKLFVGYVPRTQLTNPLANYRELTARIDYYASVDDTKPGTWYAVLYEQSRPTSQQYAAMKAKCLETGIPMPAYDTRAYSAYWSVVTNRLN